MSSSAMLPFYPNFYIQIYNPSKFEIHSFRPSNTLQTVCIPNKSKQNFTEKWVLIDKIKFS